MGSSLVWGYFGAEVTHRQSLKPSKDFWAWLADARMGTTQKALCPHIVFWRASPKEPHGGEDDQRAVSNG